MICSRITDKYQDAAVFYMIRTTLKTHGVFHIIKETTHINERDNYYESDTF